MNEQSRINAMIAYFFLGPLFLIVPKDTPLGEEYVRGHAKRASVIIIGSMSIISAYLILLKPILEFEFFSISIHSVILATLMTILCTLLIHGAYRAYHGIDAKNIHTVSFDMSSSHIEGIYSEEEKIRILASFIPFIGIFVAKKYPTEPCIIGQKVGGAIAFILITLIVFYGGSVSTLVFAITILTIVGFIITAVHLFLHEKFLSLWIYKFIPTYTSIEAHIVASILSLFDFFRIAFGSERHEKYQSIYSQKKNLYETKVSPINPYILPTYLIGIPIINLITLPSLMISRVHEYRPLIFQGLMMSLILVLIIWNYGLQSPMALYILFPSITLIVHSKENIHTRAPLVSWIVSITSIFAGGKKKIDELEKGKVEVNFKYEAK